MTAAFHADWPNALDAVALIALVVAFGGVLLVARRERFKFIEEVDTAFNALPLVRLRRIEDGCPDVVRAAAR